jgi:hypothetical protein
MAERPQSIAKAPPKHSTSYAFCYAKHRKAMQNVGKAMQKFCDRLRRAQNVGKAMQMARKAMQGIGKWPERLCRA